LDWRFLLAFIAFFIVSLANLSYASLVEFGKNTREHQNIYFLEKYHCTSPGKTQESIF